ncbi:porin [Ferrimonas sp. SCSIO 43195]|uniref:porin n=1 Tax=Ferrimonas sp. SCSIO 43195 TaxID=2822844 RepID=UPI0020753421|nr:porin [Ferrimonas sp. SCSIO 43195]USD39367.1 porin [Ferrimonas sp. SCSIO 43195]
MMKNTSLISAAILAALPLASALAADDWAPKLYGDLRAQAQFQSDNDYETEIYQANLGLKGIYKNNGLMVRYNTRLQYSDNFGDASAFNDIELIDANLIVAYKNLGGFFIGEGTTGTWVDLYSKVDIHESNSMEPSSNGHLFEQAKYGHNQLAYFTPKFKGDWGTLWFKAAIITPNDSNDADADVLGLRALYHSEHFNLVINRAEVDDKMLPTDDNYVRWAVASDVRWHNFTLAALAELNQDSPKKIKDTYATALTYSLDNIDFGISYQQRRYESEANKDDQTLTIASVKYHFDQHITLFAEGAVYKHDPDTISGNSNNDNNVNLGFIFKY